MCKALSPEVQGFHLFSKSAMSHKGPLSVMLKSIARWVGWERRRGRSIEFALWYFLERAATYLAGVVRPKALFLETTPAT